MAAPPTEPEQQPEQVQPEQVQPEPVAEEEAKEEVVEEIVAPVDEPEIQQQEPEPEPEPEPEQEPEEVLEPEPEETREPEPEQVQEPEAVEVQEPEPVPETEPEEEAEPAEPETTALKIDTTAKPAALEIPASSVPKTPASAGPTPGGYYDPDDPDGISDAKDRKALLRIEELQRQLQERGIELESAIRESLTSGLEADESGASDETMMAEWFDIIRQRNELVFQEEEIRLRYEYCAQCNLN